MYLILDTETTGFPHWTQPPDFYLQARVCQIACILLDDEFKELGAFYSLIEPDNWIISQGAAGAHGITNEDCFNYGIPIKNALEVFQSFMEKANFVVCHGVKFDTFMLDVELILDGKITYNWDEQSICTLKASRKICELRNIVKRGPGLNLKELYKECIGEELSNAHDAMIDVQATAKCFAYLIENGHIILPNTLVKKV